MGGTVRIGISGAAPILVLLFLVLIRAVRLLRIFRPALRDVIATLPLRRLVGIAARLLAVVARAALHLQILWSVLLV